MFLCLLLSSVSLFICLSADKSGAGSAIVSKFVGSVSGRPKSFKAQKWGSCVGGQKIYIFWKGVGVEWCEKLGGGELGESVGGD